MISVRIRCQRLGIWLSSANPIIPAGRKLTMSDVIGIETPHGFFYWSIIDGARNR